MDDNYTLLASNGTSSPSTDTSSSQSSVVTPLLISAAGVVGTLLIIFAYHILVAKFCFRRRRRPAANGGDGGGKGVGARVLAAIPIIIYSEEKEIHGGDWMEPPLEPKDCVICIGELEEGETVRLLPSCGHVFHASCVDHWFSAHSSCPTCRASVVPVHDSLSTGAALADVEAYSTEVVVVPNCSVRHGDRPFLKVKRSLSMDDINYDSITLEGQCRNFDRTLNLARMRVRSKYLRSLSGV